MLSVLAEQGSGGIAGLSPDGGLLRRTMSL
jgi:hypothetical protein